jgi:hypothetical protein
MTVKDQDKLPIDLTVREILIIALCVLFMFFFNFIVNIFI